jgi:hypothetical protein
MRPGSESERPAPSKSFGRRTVLEDQRDDRPGRVPWLETLGHHLPGRPLDRDSTAWIDVEISHPIGTGLAGGHEEAAVWLFDEADVGDDRHRADPPLRLDAGDLAPSHELLADVVRRPGHGPQRPRCCQDLPSVTTAGA